MKVRVPRPLTLFLLTLVPLYWLAVRLGRRSFDCVRHSLTYKMRRRAIEFGNGFARVFCPRGR